MKFFVNNNTTYNYSYYATRPRWLVEAFPKVLLPQKEFKASFLYLKKSSIQNNLALASSTNHTTPADQKLKNQGAFPAKESFFTQTHLKKDFLKKKASAFSKKTQTKNQNTVSQQLEGERVALKTHSKIIMSTKKTYRYLFQTKELLCWTSDLSFFNLRGYFSNILKVLQICRFAVRNNKKILFIKGSHSSNGQEKLLSPWLLQYERNTVPLILNNLLNKTYFPTRPLLFPQIFWLKKNKTNPHKIKDSDKITNVFSRRHLASLKRVSKKSKITKTTSAPFESYLKKQQDAHFSRLQEKNQPEKTQNNLKLTTPQNIYFQLSDLSNYTRFRTNGGIKSSYFIHFGLMPLLVFQKTPLYKKSKNISWSEGASLGAGQQKKACFLERHSYIKEQNGEFQEGHLKNSNRYKQPLNVIKIKTAQQRVKLWLKEAQIMSQQTATGLTIPLTGFLTNSKTTFNTIYNQSNYDFYNFINSKLKSNDVLDQGINQMKINRLEKAYFQKSNRDLPLAKKEDTLLGELPNLFGKKKSILRRKTIKGIYNKCGPEKQESRNSFKSLKNKIRQKQPCKKHANNEIRDFSCPNIFETKYIRKVKKSKNKGFIQCFLKKTIDYALKPQDRKKQHNLNLRGYWIDHSSTHNYLSFESNTLGLLKNNKFINYNEKIKKSKSASEEYCFFGDIFTWQSKSHKSYSIYYFNTIFNKNKDNIISYLKKQVIPEKRRPLVKRKKKPSFFTHFKKQSQIFRGFHSLRKKLGQTKETFLKKRQLLSTLAKFIVFYFYDSNRNVKSRIKRRNKNRTYIGLPSFLSIRSTIKILHSGFKRCNRKPTYGYNLGSDMSEHTNNYQQNKTKTLQLRPLYKVKESKEGASIFSRKIVPFFKEKGQRINETLPQKKQRLRSLIFYKYYKAIIGLNHFNQYKMFAKTPFLNNQLADVIFFINPEKNRRLVNQANSLRIPTVGITSGNMTSAQGHQGYNDFRLKQSVYYPIIGNPTSSFFTRAIISLIVKCLRVEKFKN